MFNFIFLLLVFLLVFPLHQCVANVDSAEIMALYDLYYYTNGEDWNYGRKGAIWNFTTPDPNPCNPIWQGLTCQCTLTDCFVTEIDLNEYNLIGHLPATIGNLTELTYLALSNNLLEGNIPNTIGGLMKLTYLDLSYNYYLTGPIPSTIGSLTLLTKLYLTYNSFTGFLPLALFNLVSLKSLQADENQIIGTIPTAVGNLTNVTTLDFGNNLLTGQVPAEIGSMTNIQSLILSGNFFNGSIPSEICRLKHLMSTDWKNSGVSGTIPSCIGEITTLKELYLGDNELTGPVPESICLLVDLIVHLESNYLTGPLPPNIFNASEIISFSSQDNYLTGPLPGVFLKTIVLLNLQDNFLSGSILDSLCHCPLMEILVLSNNFIEGSIPSCLYKLNFMIILSLDYNQLTGTIPETVSQLLDGGFYSVNNNMLTGTIPGSLCLWDLESLDLSYNYLEGTIPDCNITTQQVGNVTRIVDNMLSYFGVNNNLLSGTLPHYLENEPFLSSLILNNNVLSGTLPSFDNATLLYLYVQGNKFRGRIHIHYENSTIEYIDLSNNQFTGPLPAELFNVRSNLKSFAAVSNCITGSIPEEICSVRSLLFLDLDGLTTASVCRSPIFPALKSFTSYTLPVQIVGGIPVCLFNMTNLRTLHLSGNSIQWSFPKDDGTESLFVRDSLTQLSLSHNKLTGTIPAAVQNRRWTSLDLSYNKLVGILDFVEQVNGNSTLVLQINRLSGKVPDSLLNLVSINILTGNMFSCSVSRNTLPIHDSAYPIYQCGSDSFNQASIIWFCCASAAFVAIAAGWFFRYYWWRQFVRWCKNSWEALQRYLGQFNDMPGNHKLYQFSQFVISVRNTIVLLTVGILIVFMPLYAALTEYFKTAEYQYAWTVSAAFLSGEIPAIVLLLFYLAFILILFVVWLLYTDQLQWVAVKLLKNDAVESTNTDNSTRWLTSQCVSLTCVVVFNCLVISLVNGVYVVVILNYNTEIIFFAQVFTALFKLLWNDFAVRGMILMARRVYGVECFKWNRKGEDSPKTIDDGGMHRKVEIEEEDHDPTFVVQEMLYMTFIVLFNSIIAPCLATATVDSNCFYNVFVAPAAVSTLFPVTSAVPSCSYEELDNSIDSLCNATITVSYFEVSYDPPFIYSYQCTSSILTNYASVYVFMFLMVAFIKPMVLYVMLLCHTWLKEWYVLHAMIDTTIYGMLKPANEEQLMRSLQSGRRNKTLFHRERFVLRTVGKIAVFVTFGVIFPPLAVVLCVAFVSETYLNLVIIGRFLSQIKEETVRNKFRELLNRDCEDCTDLLLVPLMRLVVPFAALFYGFFVFDIYGDKVGFRRSIWAPLLLVLFPVLLWVGYSVYLWRERSEVKTESRTVNVNGVNGVEMMVVGNAMRGGDIVCE